MKLLIQNLVKTKNTFISICFLLSSNNIFSQINILSKIKFLQADSIFAINKDYDSITLYRDSFSIRFFSNQYDDKKEKYYATQIAVLSDEKALDDIKIGKTLAEFSFFDIGTGMAPGYNNMYDTVFITNEGHNYIYYQNEKDKRAFLISKKEDKLELEWRIKAANYKEKEQSFAELPFKQLYFIVLSDNNLNGKINKGEINIIKVKFR